MSEYSGYRSTIGSSPASASSSDYRSESPASSSQESEDIQPSARRKPIAPANTRSDFTEPSIPCQFKLPRDLVASLKLHAISQNRSMSDIVLECLTSDMLVGKAWVSSRRAG